MVEGLFRFPTPSEAEPVNLGNPTEWSIPDLMAAVEAILGRRFTVTYNPLPQDDPRMRQQDITRPQGGLGWEPKVDLEAGLRETVAYFREKGMGVWSLFPFRHSAIDAGVKATPERRDPEERYPFVVATHHLGTTAAPEGSPEPRALCVSGQGTHGKDVTPPRPFARYAASPSRPGEYESRRWG